MGNTALHSTIYEYETWKRYEKEEKKCVQSSKEVKSKSVLERINGHVLMMSPFQSGKKMNPRAEVVKDSKRAPKDGLIPYLEVFMVTLYYYTN